jgi:hypothetical protein
MVVGVVANGMAILLYLLEDIGVFADIVAYAKKRGFGLELMENFEDFGGYFRNRTIIESCSLDNAPLS